VEFPKPGKSLVLWLDFDLQKKIKEEMEKKIKEVGAKGGAAVAIDPKTGGVLALVSLPSFDNNLFSKGISQEDWEKLQKDPKSPLLNRATSGQYLFGSTVKPFIALAALEEKIISPNKKIDCQGKIEIPHRYNPEIVYEFRDWTVHGPTDIKKAIAESCNVFFYTIGGGYKNQEGLGPSKIKKYLEIFGFGKLIDSDFPIPSFAKGLIGDPEWKKEKFGENWWDGDTYNMSIGQGYILTTPLQVARAFAAIANGGKLLKPRFVKEIVNEERNVVEVVQPEIENEIKIDPKNLQIVKEGMRWAVTGQNSPHASAIALNDLPVAVAAKTGTAQTLRKGCEDCYTIWISAFAPYEDPQIVLTIVLEEVKGRLSQVVVPVAKEILNWYFSK
jgi:penicillin-binding protein 2